ncbi:hypothetical protein Tco_0764391 [Tanacetum coccineum]
MKFEQKLHESLFEAWERYKLSIERCPNHNMLLVTQIDTFYNGLTLSHRDTINAAAGGTFMQKTPEEYYELIKNMTAHHNHWDTSATRDEMSRNISSTTTTESPEVFRQLKIINKNFVEMMRQIQTIKSVDTKCETYGGPHSFTECLAADGYTQDVAYATTAISTRSGVAYDGPTIPPTPSPFPKVVERETEVTKDKVQNTNFGSTAHIQPPVVQDPIPEPEVAPKPNPKPSIPYPSRLNDQKLREKANNQMTERALIDVHGEEMTLRVNDEGITFKFGHTSRYSSNYYDETVHQVNVIDIACEEYAQEVLGFSDSSTSGNPTPSDPIIASSFPSFTPFEGEDPSPTLPLMKNDDLKQVDVTLTKPSIEEPPELELKDLPSHLEYAFLEGTDKLPGIDPSFCTHKILMKDDFKPAVQHQRRANPKIYEVIKKEVIKLLDAELIYPISDSLWVSRIHCVPKKGGMIVVENEDNELIPTRHIPKVHDGHFPRHDRGNNGSLHG